jgi:glutaredoxin
VVLVGARVRDQPKRTGAAVLDPETASAWSLWRVSRATSPTASPSTKRWPSACTHRKKPRLPLVDGASPGATCVAFCEGNRTHHSSLGKGFRGISSLRSGIPRPLPIHPWRCFSAPPKGNGRYKREDPPMSEPLTVYTLPNCIQCTLTKRALDKTGLPYQLVDLTDNEDARTLVTQLGTNPHPSSSPTQHTGPATAPTKSPPPRSHARRTRTHDAGAPGRPQFPAAHASSSGGIPWPHHPAARRTPSTKHGSEVVCHRAANNPIRPRSGRKNGAHRLTVRASDRRLVPAGFRCGARSHLWHRTSPPWVALTGHGESHPDLRSLQNWERC